MSKSNMMKGRKGNGHKGAERGKGCGTLEKRGRVYIARWTVNGKRFAQSTKTGDRREAEARLAEIVAPFRLRDNAERLEAFAGKLSGVEARIREFEESRPALKIADAWAAYVDSPNRSDTAGEKRLHICERWFARLAGWVAAHNPEIVELRGIGREIAAAFLADEFGNCGASLRNQALVFYRRMWRVLKLDEAARLGDNPFEGIAKKHETHVRRRELTVEELARVCGSLEGEMRLLFLVGVYTGQRLGDCACLEWGGVDMVRRRVSLIPRKTMRKVGRLVVIPMHENLYRAFAEIPPESRRGYVMPTCAAEYLTDNGGLSDRFVAAFKKCGIVTSTAGANGRNIPLAGFHSLRHTFVSLAANAGVPFAVVQSIVGHSTAAMTAHYYHESENALTAAVAVLPDLTGGAAAGVSAVGASASVSARVRSICAAVDELTDAERAEVLRHLTGGAAAGAALPCPECAGEVAAVGAVAAACPECAGEVAAVGAVAAACPECAGEVAAA